MGPGGVTIIVPRKHGGHTHSAGECVDGDEFTSSYFRKMILPEPYRLIPDLSLHTSDFIISLNPAIIRRPKTRARLNAI